jgi:hypothetical protein
METDSSSPQQPAPRQPQPGMPPRPMQPMGRRPMVDGFAPRRPMTQPNTSPARPTMGQAAPRSIPIGGDIQASRPISQPQPQHQPQSTVAPAAAALPRSQQPQPFATRPMGSSFGGTAHSTPVAARPNTDDDMPPASKAHMPKERSSTGHAGIAGFGALIVLGALFLLPIIPGKVIQNFPLASSNLSTGNQSLDCIGTQGTLRNSTVYNTKAGAPLTYSYSTTTNQSATCNGKLQNAEVEHTSEFSPLALVVDTLLAIILAMVVARVWRMIFGEKQHSPRS